MSVPIDDDLNERIRSVARLRELQPDRLVLEAITQYLERAEARQSFEEDARSSWTAYQQTGRHLTGEEAEVWLQTWGTATEAEMPECHE